MKRALALACALFATTAAEAKPWVTRWFAFEIVENHIHVPIRISGVDAAAILDTGANIGFVDREFAEAHGVRVLEGMRAEVHGANSTRRVPLAPRVPVELFGAKFDLRYVPAGNLRSAQVLIGADVLSSFVLQIDYENARIRFASADAFALEELANVELRRETITGLPAVRATIDGEPKWLLLDTGMSGPMELDASFIEGREWEELSGAQSGDIHGTRADHRAFRVPLLQLGPFDLQGVHAFASAKSRIRALAARSDDLGARTSGILGAEVLKHFLVTLDLKHRKLHIERSQRAEPTELQPAPEPSAPDPAPSPSAP